MNGNDKQNRIPNCDHNNHRTIGPKRRWLDGPAMDVFDAKYPNLEKLPPNCLQHILSFMAYGKVSEMRQVSKVFEETVIKLLDQGKIELERQLEREMERAKDRVFCPTNVRSSYHTLHFLIGLREAINDCTVNHYFYPDYCVAGKLLDEANCLLMEFNSSTTVPYFLEHVRDQRPHPFLSSILALSERAFRRFKTKILSLSDHSFYIGQRRELSKRKRLEIKMQDERDERTIMKAEVLRSLRQRIDCGNQLNQEFLKLIVKLNEKVLELTQRANKVEIEVNCKMNGPIVPTNCLFQLFTLSGSSLGATKVMGTHNSKLLNLATLSSSAIRNIVSHFSCHRIAQLRIVCKSFNEACKKELNQDFETLKQELELQIKRNERIDMHKTVKEQDIKSKVLKDVYSFLELCKENYKQRLGTQYCFAAGKVLDEAIRIYYNELYPLYYDISVYLNDDIPLRDYRDYKPRPHYHLFPLMDLVYKAIAHFKFTIVPGYFPFAQNPSYVPDYIITGDVINFEKESQLQLEEIETLIEKADIKMKKQNDMNGKFLKIIVGLKKKVNVLNNETSQIVNLLKEQK